MIFFILYLALFCFSFSDYAQIKNEPIVKNVETPTDIQKKQQDLTKLKELLTKKQEQRDEEIRKETKNAQIMREKIRTTKQDSTPNIKARQELADQQLQLNLAERDKTTVATMIDAINNELKLLTQQLSQLREHPLNPLPIAKKTLLNAYSEALDIITQSASRAYDELAKTPQPGEPDRWKELYEKISNAIKQEMVRFQNNQSLDWKKRKAEREKALRAQLGTSAYDAAYNSDLNQLQLAQTGIIKQLLNFIDQESQSILKQLDEKESRLINTGLFSALDEEQKQLINFQQKIKQNSPFAQIPKQMNSNELYRRLTGHENPYTVLGVDFNATPDEIQKAYAAQLTKASINPQESARAFDSISGDTRGQTDTMLDFLAELNKQLVKKIQDQEGIFLRKVSSGIENLGVRAQKLQTEQQIQGPSDFPPTATTS